MFKNLYINTFLYVGIGLVPYILASDKAVSQVLYLNVLNALFFSHLLLKYRKRFFQELIEKISYVPVILFTLFFIWCLISILFSINKVEALSTCSEILTYLISLILLTYNVSKIKDYQKLIYYIVILLLSAEIIGSLLGYFFDIINFGAPTPRAQKYRGITGNINITAYLMLIKIPFLYYFRFIRYGNSKLLLFLTITSMYCITAIFETRSAILTLFLITLFALITYNYIKFNAFKFELKSSLNSILKPLLIAVILNFAQSNYFQVSNIQDRLSTLTEINEDESLSQRLRYYKSAFDSFTKSPIIGIGIGGWEIESVKYENPYLDSYVVPYHAHNDYLETLAETGIIGFLLYFGMIFYMVFTIIFFILNKKAKKEEKLFLSAFLLAIIVYLIDSMFNFPFDRAVQQMHLMFFLSVAIFISKSKKIRINYSNFKAPLLILIILTPLNIYSSSRLMISSRHQAILLRQFNLDDYSKPPIEEVEKFEMTYKNLTGTSMPMVTIKGLYYLKNEKYNESIKYLKQGIKHNPYIYINESFLGFAYSQLEEHDSAVYYSKKAFKNTPNNIIHYANYLYSMSRAKDSFGIKEAYKSIQFNYKTSEHDELYLLAMASIIDSDNTSFVLDDFDLNIQAGNDRLKKGYYVLKVGELEMYEADEFYQKGMYYFENGNFDLALENFINASNINQFELVYKENIANTYIRLGLDDKALETLNNLINVDNYTGGKAFYLRGLLLYQKGDSQNACKDFVIADKSGLFQNTNLLNLFCNN